MRNLLPAKSTMGVLLSATKLDDCNRGFISKAFGTTIPKKGPSLFILLIFDIKISESAAYDIVVAAMKTRKPRKKKSFRAAILLLLLLLSKS